MSNTPDETNAESMLQVVLNIVPVRVFWKDTHSKFLGANQLFLNDLGVNNLRDIVGKSDFDFSENSEDARKFIKDDALVMQTAQAKLDIEERQIVPGQADRWLRTNKVPMFDEQGGVVGLMGTYEDITPQITDKLHIANQSRIDFLTGMANRNKLQDAINNFSGDFAGLMFIDLDHFKAVNDSYGHCVGDLLLKHVASRLLALNLSIENCHDEVLITRLGGDEFGIFIPCGNLQNAQEQLEMRASNIVDSLVEPFLVDDNIVTLGASVGITIVDKQLKNSATGFIEADMAMYAAKEKGRNTYQFYDVSMKQEAERKHELKTCLMQAIENKELRLVYQPQIDSNNNIIGAEALLRWHSRKLGFVPPDEFIPLAEESGLILSIGEWVLNTALDTLAIWLPWIKDKHSFKMAVNFSSKQFQDKNIAKKIESCLNAREIDPKYLQIEITESVLIDHKDQVVQSMLRLQKLGTSIAIDDFGTGYSSLSYLAILPIDKLKIDRAFVSNLHQQGTNYKLVAAMVSMAENLHMEVIAEGVETLEERAALVALKCYQFQGYYFSKPIDAEQLQALYL